MAQHTPGPWVWRATNGGLYRLGDPPYAFGEAVLVPADEYDTGLDIIISEEDACLIAAAPDMLAALEKGLSWVQWVAANHPDPGFSEPAARAVAEFEAALAKAHGEDG